MADKKINLVTGTTDLASTAGLQESGGQTLAMGAVSDGQFLKRVGTDIVGAAGTAGSGDVSSDIIWDAKGDLAVGTGANTASKLVVGTNGHILTADSTAATGLKWAAAPGGADPTAVHIDGANEISGVAAKASPVSGDFILIEDSQNGNVKKSITIGDLPGGGSGGTVQGTDGNIYNIRPAAAVSVGTSPGEYSVEFQPGKTSGGVEAQGDYSGILSGRDNRALADHSSILGGATNSIYGNTLAGTYSAIGGGRGNNITSSASGAYSAQFAVIAGGSSNDISGDDASYSTIGGGSSNSIIADGGFFDSIANTIVGGSVNTINSTARLSTIGGGSNNTISHSKCFVAGEYSGTSAHGQFVFTAGRGSTYSPPGALLGAAYFHLQGGLFVDNIAPVFLKEQANAATSQASFGQIWVKNTTPNELWFTDDAGADHQLGVGGGSVTRTITLSWNAPGDDATTGTKKAYFVVPPSMNGMDLTFVHAEVATAGTTGTQTFDINKNGSSMLSTLLTIDSGETGSDTAAAPVVINTAQDNVVTYDVISVDVDLIHTTAAKGELITLEFTTP